MGTTIATLLVTFGLAALLAAVQARQEEEPPPLEDIRQAQQEHQDQVRALRGKEKKERRSPGETAPRGLVGAPGGIKE